jgi:succinate dehydrogenase / fumarate reductase cytochrome b subunit
MQPRRSGWCTWSLWAADGARSGSPSAAEGVLGAAEVRHGVTGAVLVLYLAANMIGNLKIFLGEESLNTYAEWLRVVGEPALPEQTLLWLVRIVLLVSVVAHVVAATILARRAWRARPVRYAHRRPVSTSYASRTMRWGGVIILLFVIYHILDLTTGTLNPNGVLGEVYDNVVADFSRWYITLAYTLAVVTVGFHVPPRRLERPADPRPLQRPVPDALQGDRARLRGRADRGLPGRPARSIGLVGTL